MRNYNFDTDLGKLPPQALEFEECVLGAILLDVRAMSEVAKQLKVDSFYKHENQRVYKACLDMWIESEPIDIVTVTQWLRHSGELEMIGGAYYISKLTSRVNSAANLQYHCRIIQQFAIKRQMITIGSKMVTNAYEDQYDAFDLIDDYNSEINEIYQEIKSIATKGTKEHAEEAKEQLKQAVEGGGPPGITTGLSELNRVTGGWKPGDQIIIAARPGMGKTALLITIVRAQLAHGLRVAVFSLEMTGIQLMFRIAAQEERINYRQLEFGQISKEQHERINIKFDELSRNKNLLINDKAAINPMYIKGELMNFNADCVFVDYLQLMTGDKSLKFSSTREGEVADISKTLKQLAKDNGIPVISLCQLNRAVETRGGDKKPMLSDLRESGSIEQDADQVIFLYRASYYGFRDRTDASGQTVPLEPGESLAIIGKNRNGKTGQVRIKFIEECMLFTDMHEDDDTVPEFREAGF
ncbi:MAG: replicative DNA helicase [Bacteroidetes bacterium]|nr:replicative DNA helicase [Bacteroidota bacterium]